MQIGAVFSSGEVGADVAGTRDWSQAVQDLGYDFVVSADHVVGADPEGHPELERVYSIESRLHEPLTLFAFMAGVAPRLGFLTSVIILPQRQTALVAKQAAEVDVLSGGKLRLGIGVGWNPVEYEALGVDFHQRGRIVEEQIELLRLLWSQEIVTYHGQFHTVNEAGINPLPIHRNIPIWTGGRADVLLRRTARLADGWFPLGRPNEQMQQAIQQLRAYLREVGRDPATFGIEAQINARDGNLDEWLRQTQQWQALGATHICFNTMGAGFTTLAQHLDAIRRYKEALP